MMLLSAVIETFEAEFLAQYQHAIRPVQRQALGALKDCRTSRSLLMQAHCNDCEQDTFVPHSCGHRLCPHCQHHESQQWLERQLQKQVPAEYFLLTFTLPAELRSLAFLQQHALYTLMIRCSWETLRSFSQNDSQLQGTPGAIAVLHTHSRRLDYHPHVHIVMPAAAIDPKRRLWRSKSGFLFKHKALASVFRGKMLAAIHQAGLTMPSHYPKKWVVDVRSVGSGKKALIYLGRYLYKGVIQEKDIIACDNGQVTFRFLNSKSKKWQTITVPGARFLWLILQHVLPKGFRRARNFGFLHPNSKRMITILQYQCGINPNQALAWLKQRPALICRCCGAPMQIIRTRIRPNLHHYTPVSGGASAM